MNALRTLILLIFCLGAAEASQKVLTGIERIVSPEYQSLIRNKKVGLVTNQTGVTGTLQSNREFLGQYREALNVEIIALFAPEHGITGASHAAESVKDTVDKNIPIYSLHGKHRRPNKEMLKNIDVLIFDIQDIGSRSYTYSSTLFYVMEEAAKHNIPVIVTDRPNPINGRVVDGPMLDPKWRSFIGYINVPYCHGMTIGELAKFFNAEYKIGCELKVVPMKGWNRDMTFHDTGLPWVPTSPNIPEDSTPLYYPMTGIIGELRLVNIGIGYTLPFKVVGAPWIQAETFAQKLNDQKLPGVLFQPFHYKPFYGKFAKENCQGIMIVVNDPSKYLPVATQYMIMGLLKSLYPKEFKLALNQSRKNRDLFNKVNGTDRPFKMLETNPYPAWSLREIDQRERQEFMRRRARYLIGSYDQGAYRNRGKIKHRETQSMAQRDTEYGTEEHRD
ncbi:MAG: hypothetical protein K940chlam3_00803 [Chlamydiae bacterium]|nr:hypothetical protein [Chlamydiota bacterium]